jgi:DNA-binding NarL/FixJ family response regulator
VIKVVIADDHALMREGLKHILQTVTDIQICAEATNGFETLQSIRSNPCDVLIMDLSMPGKGGMELIRQVKEEVPQIHILVLTMHEEHEYAARAIRAGALGYMTKEGAGTQLVIAIRRVATGRPYISMDVAEQLAIDAMPTNEKLPHTSLSDREMEVFNLLVNGKTATEIGTLLHLSTKNISSHKSRILQKMNSSSLADLVRYAVTHDLLLPLRK